jgi:hypothetical protein
MCHATTKSGKVCKIKSENYFCHIHREIEVSVISESSVRSTSDAKPSLDKQREDALQKILFSFVPSNINTYQREAWPLFKDIDLTAESLNIIKRAKYLSNWPTETYDSLISTYFDDGVNNDVKYGIIRDTIVKYIRLQKVKDALTSIQICDLYKALILLFVKYMLSRGRYFDTIRDIINLYLSIFPQREKYVKTYREENLNKLRVKAVEKHTPICDDVRKYIISQYL